MAYIVKSLYDFLAIHSRDNEDPRTKEWIFMGNPIKIVIILLSYTYFVKILGPSFMKNRQPFELKLVMMIYNILQVILNLSVVVMGVYFAYWKANYSLLCQPLHYDSDEMTIQIISVAYYYFLLKLFDLFDTVFFVLRKKYNQISFLHFYHHNMMVILVYIGIKYFPTGHGYLLGILNAFVHVIMYFYYLISTFKTELKRSLWWKKYITQIQLLQFVLLFIYFGRPLIMQDCSYPNYLNLLGAVQSLFMMCLFSDFYYKVYIKKQRI